MPRLFLLLLTGCCFMVSTLVQAQSADTEGPFEAQFTFTSNCLTVLFNNISSESVANTWNFGDGSPLSGEEDPIHEFPSTGVYEVELTVISASSGQASVQHEVSVEACTGVEELTPVLTSCYPNPTQHEIHFIFDARVIQTPHQLQIFNANGQLVRQQRINQTTLSMNASDFDAGLYYYQVHDAVQVAANGTIVVQ